MFVEGELIMKVIEMTGKNVDEAVQAALKELNAVREQVDVEILETSGKKYFGFFGDKPAKVRVTVVRAIATKEESKPTFAADSLPQEKIAPKLRKPVSEETFERPEKRKERREGGERRERRDRASDNRVDRVQKVERLEKTSEPVVEKVVSEQAVESAKSFLENVFQSMDLRVTMERRVADGTVTFNLHGEDLGILIGKHGQTLDSLQYLTNLVANKDAQDRTRFIIDIENYRQRRVETLMVLAKKLASQVKRTREKVVLEPMTPHERKIIHMALQDDRRVTTNSEGEEPHRYVVIELR